MAKEEKEAPKVDAKEAPKEAPREAPKVDATQAAREHLRAQHARERSARLARRNKEHAETLARLHVMNARPKVDAKPILLLGGLFK